MNSVVLALSLAGTAAAQIVAGQVSMVASSQIYGTASAADNQAYATSTGYYSGAPASQYTQPPAATDGGYSMMPYSSFTQGGYKSMGCGYGYTKASDGSCQAMGWVSVFVNLVWARPQIVSHLRASISGRPRGATKRSSSTSEYNLPLAVRASAYVLFSGGSGGYGGGGYGGSYGGNSCDSYGATQTVTMTDTMTVTQTQAVVSDVSARCNKCF